MDEKELKQILATKAPAYQRSLIEIPGDSIVPHLSSLTDYLDSVLGDSREMQNKIDNLVMHYRIGAVDETKNEHIGTVLPRINRKGMIVGGSVIYYNADDGAIIDKAVSLTISIPGMPSTTMLTQMSSLASISIVEVR